MDRLVVVVVLVIVVIAEVEVVATGVVLVSPLPGCVVVSSFRALDDVVTGGDIVPVGTARLCVRFVEKLEVLAVVGNATYHVSFVGKSEVPSSDSVV